MQKQIIGFVFCALIAAGASFYGGMLYERGKQNAERIAFSQGRAQMFRGGTGVPSTQGFRNGGRNGNGIAAGEILTIDDKSLTLKLQDGGSKIILVSPSMSINTFSAASSSDLVTGTSILVTGEANADGSMTAQSIQIRPFPDMPRDNRQKERE